MSSQSTSASNFSEGEKLLLGDGAGGWDRFLLYISRPFLRTPHYNVNGQNIFRSRFTACFGIALFLSLLLLVSGGVVPVFLQLFEAGEYRSTQRTAVPLYNTLALRSNGTAENGFFQNYLYGGPPQVLDCAIFNQTAFR